MPDWIKGIAIVLMVYGHTSHVGSLASFQYQTVKLIYTFHMPLFLIISGYFFNAEAEPYAAGKKIANRILRPYLIFISLYLAGLLLIQRIGIQTTNAPSTSCVDFLKTVFLHPRGAYWYLHSIILLQSSFVIAKVIELRTRIGETASNIVSMFIIAMLCHYEIIMLRICVYFLVGMTFKRLYGALPSSLNTGLCLMCGILVLMQSTTIGFSLMEVVWVLAVMSFLAGVGNSLRETAVVRLFAWLGRNSLVILVIHAAFTVLSKRVSPFLLEVDSTGLLYSVAVLGTTIFGCIAFAFLSDKLRISPYLFGDKLIYSRFQESNG